MITSSSMPYSFICCKPHPSLIRFGIYFFRSPVRFGVWYIRISTLSAPNSETNGARREAHDGFGDSLVPLNASVRMLNLSFGLARSACWSVDIWTSVNRSSRQRLLEQLLIHALFCLCTTLTRRFLFLRSISWPASISLCPSTVSILSHLQRLIELRRRP